MIASGEVSAPGKVILSGEHSAVYGHPVLVMAINKRIKFRFQLFTGANTVEILDDEGKTIQCFASADKNEIKLLEYARTKFTDIPPFKLTLSAIEQELPIGAGLGSSAAFAACLSAAICLSMNAMSSQKLEPSHLDDVIFDCTHHYEKLQHGKPSGCDATCVLKGGLLSYQLR